MRGGKANHLLHDTCGAAHVIPPSAFAESASTTLPKANHASFLRFPPLSTSPSPRVVPRCFAFARGVQLARAVAHRTERALAPGTSLSSSSRRGWASRRMASSRRPDGPLQRGPHFWTPQKTRGPLMLRRVPRMAQPRCSAPELPCGWGRRVAELGWAICGYLVDASTTQLPGNFSHKKNRNRRQEQARSSTRKQRRSAHLARVLGFLNICCWGFAGIRRKVNQSAFDGILRQHFGQAANVSHKLQ